MKVSYYSYDKTRADGTVTKCTKCCIITANGRKFTAVAKCGPNDTYDLDKGKNVALMKCVLKAKEKTLDRLISDDDKLRQNVSTAENAVSKNLARIKACREDIVTIKKELVSF